MMRIDKVILASDKNDKYLSFWPKVSEVWENIGIDPILIFVGTEPIDLCKDDNVFFFDSKEINPGFIARNIRMLYPALFPNDICPCFLGNQKTYTLKILFLKLFLLFLSMMFFWSFERIF